MYVKLEVRKRTLNYCIFALKARLPVVHVCMNAVVLTMHT